MNDTPTPFDDFDLEVSCEETYEPTLADIEEYEEYLDSLAQNG